MFNKLETGFLDAFADLHDQRSSRNRLYSVSEILLITLCAAIAGADGWQDVEDFGNAKIDYLRQFLPFKNGIPSDDTFRRFFRALDPIHFQALFRQWVQSLRPHIDTNVIAIDGKSSRRSFDGDENMLHMVSAYATEARLVLAQEAVSKKSNEITAIPKLLDWLDLRGSVVTIDAMGCQHAIAEQILQKEGAYVLALKGNQGTLCEDVREYMQDGNILKTLDVCQHIEKGHGRIEQRTCWVSHDITWLQHRHPNWRTIRAIIRMDSTREMSNKTSNETRYYIASLSQSAEKIMGYVRSHWGIENGLHWILDMAFGEDQSRIRKENAPQIMAVIRHMALNLLQITKGQMKRQSIKRLRKIAGWDDSTLTNILSRCFS